MNVFGSQFVGTQGVTFHSFADSLEESHKWNRHPILYECYLKFFPGITEEDIRWHPAPHWNQNAGTDVTITRADSLQIRIDEKVRPPDKKFDDILCEVWSNKERQSPGWIQKLMNCHYICYVITGLGKCYLLPTLQLQAAWEKYGPAWTARYGWRNVPNDRNGRKWITANVPVPVNVLFPAMGEMLRHSFTPICAPEEPPVPF